jgi:hypothetical protein
VRRVGFAGEGFGSRISPVAKGRAAFPFRLFAPELSEYGIENFRAATAQVQSELPETSATDGSLNYALLSAIGIGNPLLVFEKSRLTRAVIKSRVLDRD